ncbi:hypothetical protein BB558_007216 [Smittium angustum]|uniref:PHD-type domain-containing protein n=1 Tax=Smittium angustum TaxID=133377 RepID=A0A2U1IVM0_SMIAN|nr:hypothetical protein BB558_007216 [Smittium angustum]
MISGNSSNSKTNQSHHKNVPFNNIKTNFIPKAATGKVVPKIENIIKPEKDSLLNPNTVIINKQFALKLLQEKNNACSSPISPTQKHESQRKTTNSNITHKSIDIKDITGKKICWKGSKIIPLGLKSFEKSDSGPVLISTSKRYDNIKSIEQQIASIICPKVWGRILNIRIYFDNEQEPENVPTEIRSGERISGERISTAIQTLDNQDIKKISTPNSNNKKVDTIKPSHKNSITTDSPTHQKLNKSNINQNKSQNDQENLPFCESHKDKPINETEDYVSATPNSNSENINKFNDSSMNSSSVKYMEKSNHELNIKSGKQKLPDNSNSQASTQKTILSPKNKSVEPHKNKSSNNYEGKNEDDINKSNASKLNLDLEPNEETILKGHIRDEHKPSKTNSSSGSIIQKIVGTIKARNIESLPKPTVFIETPSISEILVNNTNSNIEKDNFYEYGHALYGKTSRSDFSNNFERKETKNVHKKPKISRNISESSSNSPISESDANSDSGYSNFLGNPKKITNSITTTKLKPMLEKTRRKNNSSIELNQIPSNKILKGQEADNTHSKKRKYDFDSKTRSNPETELDEFNSIQLYKGKSNDACEACKQGGRFVCCDGCPRVFHFLCTEPPLDELKAGEMEHWFCRECLHKKNHVDSPFVFKEKKSVLDPLVAKLETRNPKPFSVPTKIQSEFKGVKTGNFNEYKFYDDDEKKKGILHSKNIGRNFKALVDEKGDLITCFRCEKTALHGNIIRCDYCNLAWHWDCLFPPLTSLPLPNLKWKCPNHGDDPEINTRRFKYEKVISCTDFPNSMPNNGNIEIIDDELSDNMSLGENNSYIGQNGIKGEELVEDSESTEDDVLSYENPKIRFQVPMNHIEEYFLTSTKRRSLVESISSSIKRSKVKPREWLQSVMIFQQQVAEYLMNHPESEMDPSNEENETSTNDITVREKESASHIQEAEKDPVVVFAAAAIELLCPSSPSSP